MKKNLYCPLCGRKVGEYGDRILIEYKAKCRQCKKIIVFDPDTTQVRTIEIPNRASASGMRFY